MPRTVGWKHFPLLFPASLYTPACLSPSGAFSYILQTLNRQNQLHLSFYRQVECAVMGFQFAPYQVLSSSFPLVVIDSLGMTS